MSRVMEPIMEPPFTGFVENTGDALLLFQAARTNVIPCITHRLSELERQYTIKSGSVFIWNEKDCLMKRWTDSLMWSPSRIMGNFLVYRETTVPGSGRSSAAREARHTTRSPLKYPFRIRDVEMTSMEIARKTRERSIVGSLEDDLGTFKDGGLVKKTISLSVDGVNYHLISYFTLEDVMENRLASPSSMKHIKCVGIPAELLDNSLFRQPPRVELTDGVATYVGDSTADSPSSLCKEFDSLDALLPNVSLETNAAPGTSLGAMSPGTVSQLPYAEQKIPQYDILPESFPGVQKVDQSEVFFSPSHAMPTNPSHAFLSSQLSYHHPSSMSTSVTCQPYIFPATPNDSSDSLSSWPASDEIITRSLWCNTTPLDLFSDRNTPGTYFPVPTGALITSSFERGSEAIDFPSVVSPLPSRTDHPPSLYADTPISSCQTHSDAHTTQGNVVPPSSSAPRCGSSAETPGHLIFHA